MILVKVVELIVHIHRSRNFGVYRMEINRASLICLDELSTQLIISQIKFMNLVTHNLENYANCQEDHTEYAKSQHGTHGCWNRTPSRQGLLLEL